MTKGRKITQLALIFFGFFLILATYFLYPRINKNVLDENKITKAITHTYTEQDLESDIPYLDGVPNIDETPAVTSETTESGTTMTYRIDG